jgi:hypothetical protein
LFCFHEHCLQASIKAISFGQQSDSAATSSGTDIGASGISTSPSWIISLADDVGTPAQISEASKVERSPLPSDLQVTAFVGFIHLAFEIVVVIVFQSVFYLEMHKIIYFLFFKINF